MVAIRRFQVLNMALIKLSRLLSAVRFDTQEKKCVFSPFSLNAKLVGHLYECLAPTEGEVRGARVRE